MRRDDVPAPRTVVLAIRRPLAPADVPRLCEEVRRIAEETNADLIVCDLGAVDGPDVVTADALARIQLLARRVGCQLRVAHACPSLQCVLELMGLKDSVLFER